ncbi:MAG: histone deacetylase [Chloroflexota bacterium]
MTTTPDREDRRQDAPTRRTAIVRSLLPAGHDTGAHPENPRRVAAIDAELARQGLDDGRPAVAARPAGLAALERVHDLSYLDDLEERSLMGGRAIDPETLVLADSWEAALHAAGAALAATDAVLDGRAGAAFAIARPPGHHARPAAGMGVCLLNNAAVAAAHALHRGLDRVLVLDWDAHHGNGTQEIFYASDRILYVSLHQSPLFPGTGSSAERGSGPGKGFTLNLPLPAGTGDRDYLRTFDEAAIPAIRRFRPGLILVSAGFDAHEADPLAGMLLTDDGFGALARRAAALASELCEDRLVAVLEGGYDPDALGRSVAQTIRAFDGDDAPAPAPVSRSPRSGHLQAAAHGADPERQGRA